MKAFAMLCRREYSGNWSGHAHSKWNSSKTISISACVAATMLLASSITSHFQAPASAEELSPNANLAISRYPSSVVPGQTSHFHSVKQRTPTIAGTSMNSVVMPKLTPGDKVTLESLVLIAGSGHKKLAGQVANLLKVPVADTVQGRFSDGEVNLAIHDQVRGNHVFIIQPCTAPVNDSIMELLLTISCARRSGAKFITAVIPYFGYKHRRRGFAMSTTNQSRFLTSNASDFAKMLQTVGVDRVIAVDLQRPGQGHEACFFDTTIPLESVMTTKIDGRILWLCGFFR